MPKPLPRIQLGAVNSMPSSAKPELILPHQQATRSRMTGAGGLFANENLDLLSHLLDDWFRIPGTSIRFGLDGIVGLIPGLGDILGGLASCIIVFAAWARGVPYVTLGRMGANIAIEVVVGAIPFLGDAFDIAWKANRRNYALLTRHLEQPYRQKWKDWAFLFLLFAVLLAIFFVPMLLIVWAAQWLGHHL